MIKNKKFYTSKDVKRRNRQALKYIKQLESERPIYNGYPLKSGETMYLGNGLTITNRGFETIYLGCNSNQFLIDKNG